MNKKIVSELAVGLILLIAIIMGGIAWFKNAKEIAALDSLNQNVPANVQPTKILEDKNKVAEENSCKPHYYEGKISVSAWSVSEAEDGIVVAIKKNEVSKLTIKNVDESNVKGNFTVKLIDPTDTVRAKIKASSAQKPATITLQGYAETCQQPPLVSIQPATEAFKGRS